MGTAQREGRSYSAAHFVLELDGTEVVGIIRSVDGGSVKSEIMTYQMGENYDLWRQIGKPKYEDIKLELSMSLSKGFYQWIQSFFSGKVDRRNGAVCAADFQYAERARREFRDAIISEITMPKLDGSDRNACYMNATIAPEVLRFARGTGRSLQPQIGMLRQKHWSPANFRLVLDGPLREKAARCTKIDSFTIKQQAHEYHSGDKRDPIRVPGMIEFPNITFYVPEADAEPFIDHFTKFAINGVKQTQPRLTGAIEMMDNSNSELCTIKLQGIDIASISADKSEAGSENIKEVKIEISVERMDFQYQAEGQG